jgi:hypothetical protein
MKTKVTLQNKLFIAFIAMVFGMVLLLAAGLVQAQQVPEGKVFNLDAADRVKTTNTAIYNGKTYQVFAAKNGRLYFETGKLTKTGKPQRTYITPAVKKDTP